MRTSEMPRETVEPGVPTLEPYLIAVPDALADEMAKLVDALVRRIGGECVTTDIRKMVEASVLKRGIESLKKEEWAR